MTEMHSLLEEIRLGYPVVDSVSDRLAEILESSSPLLDRLSQHLLSTSGKRIRPMLVVLSTTLGEVDLEVLVDVASSVELVHLASLVHDDVIDESRLRRGRPTVSKQWGNLVAVLAGDYLFASAFGLLTERQQHFVLRAMADAVRAMCEGEIEQALCARANGIDEREYFSHIGKKTASLMGACCQIGAHLAGAPEAQVNAMRQYGLNLGYAFQIVDDLLDIYGKEDKIGKPIWLDLKRGLSTLPVIRLAGHGDRGRIVLEMIHQLRDTSMHADLHTFQYIQNVMMETGVLEESQCEARAFAQRAIDQLDSIPLPSRARDHLSRLALAVIAQV